MNTRAIRRRNAADAVMSSGKGLLSDMAAVVGNEIALRWFAQFDSVAGELVATSAVEEVLMRRKVGAVLNQWGVGVSVRRADMSAAAGSVVDGEF